MLPKECVHIRWKNCPKIAIECGVDFANACTGFTFRHGKAAPDINGIIISKNNFIKFREYYESRIHFLLKAEHEALREKAFNYWEKVFKSSTLINRTKSYDYEETGTDEKKDNRISQHSGIESMDENTAATKDFAFEDL